jgi:hypothetical protein
MNPGFMAMMAKKKATFEKSGKDVEKKGMKEGSKADMALDQNQMGMKRGGSTSKMPTAAKMGSMNMAKGGCAMAKGGGVESKGKTKGKMITMKRGGSCK